MTTPSDHQETLDEIVRFADYQLKYQDMVETIAKEIREFAAENDVHPDFEQLVETYMEGLAQDVIDKLHE